MTNKLPSRTRSDLWSWIERHRRLAVRRIEARRSDHRQLAALVLAARVFRVLLRPGRRNPTRTRSASKHRQPSPWRQHPLQGLRRSPPGSGCAASAPTLRFCIAPGASCNKPECPPAKSPACRQAGSKRRTRRTHLPRLRRRRRIARRILLEERLEVSIARIDHSLLHICRATLPHSQNLTLVPSFINSWRTARIGQR